MKSSGDFPASWASKCGLCNRWFARGDLIAFWREPGEREKSTVHAECADRLAGLNADDLRR